MAADRLPETGYCFGSSRRRPRGPETFVLDGHQVKRYRWVGTHRIDGSECDAWKRRNIGDVSAAGLPVYVFQTRAGGGDAIG